MIDPRRYGPWAVIAGASEGIGAAFARALHAAGLHVVLVARRPEPLVELAAALASTEATTPQTPSTRHTRTVAADLATDAGVDAVFAATHDLDVGLVVVNAAYAPIGAFLDRDEADLRRAIDLNCTAPLRLARHYLPPMVARGRGGLVIMSSLAGQQGSPGISTYAATKAFGAVLAEGLWAELRQPGATGRRADRQAADRQAADGRGAEESRCSRARPARSPLPASPAVRHAAPPAR